jgi:hypothetical protein
MASWARRSARIFALGSIITSRPNFDYSIGETHTSQWNFEHVDLVSTIAGSGYAVRTRISVSPTDSGFACTVKVNEFRTPGSGNPTTGKGSNGKLFERLKFETSTVYAGSRTAIALKANDLTTPVAIEVRENLW